MKTNSIAACYPYGKRLNHFSVAEWVGPFKLLRAERRVYQFNGRGRVEVAYRSRKGTNEWDSAALEKAKFIPLGLI